MKTEDEIQRAHDILIGLVSGAVRVGASQQFIDDAAKCCDVLCWVLGHEHNNTFEDNLKRLEGWAEAKGYKIIRMP